MKDYSYRVAMVRGQALYEGWHQYTVRSYDRQIVQNLEKILLQFSKFWDFFSIVYKILYCIFFSSIVYPLIFHDDNLDFFCRTWEAPGVFFIIYRNGLYDSEIVKNEFYIRVFFSKFKVSCVIYKKAPSVCCRFQFSFLFRTHHHWLQLNYILWDFIEFHRCSWLRFWF